jgi:hypothetical protein
MSFAPKKFPVFDGAGEFINVLTTVLEQLFVFVESREVTGN